VLACGLLIAVGVGLIGLECWGTNINIIGLPEHEFNPVDSIVDGMNVVEMIEQSCFTLCEYFANETITLPISSRSLLIISTRGIEILL
jgi:hypothetical protein